LVARIGAKFGRSSVGLIQYPSSTQLASGAVVDRGETV